MSKRTQNAGIGTLSTLFGVQSTATVEVDAVLSAKIYIVTNRCLCFFDFGDTHGTILRLQDRGVGGEWTVYLLIIFEGDYDRWTAEVVPSWVRVSFHMQIYF